jgi:DNA-directed RNA polymerase sigma subunit (sigma70/sigma32)
VSLSPENIAAHAALAFRDLTDQERRVLRVRFFTMDPLSLSEARYFFPATTRAGGSAFVTRERVRQMERKALRSWAAAVAQRLAAEAGEP